MIIRNENKTPLLVKDPIIDSGQNNQHSGKRATSPRASKTFLRGADIVLSRCEHNGCCQFKVHCPFCDVEHFKPSLPARVRDHLNRSHFKHAVYLQGLMVVKCFYHCTHPSGHYHCPLCEKEILKRVAFTRHLISHVQKLGYSSDIVQAPHPKQPERVLFEGESIQLCKEKCKGSKGKHYHCPLCGREVFMDLPLFIGHLWRCKENRPSRRQILCSGETLKDLLDARLVDHITHPAQVPYFKWHKSIVRNLSDLPMSRCADPTCCEGRYHCPLCPVKKLKPNYIGYMQGHLLSHLRSGVLFKGYYILICYSLCEIAHRKKAAAAPRDDRAKTSETAFHFHCPLCGTTFVRKQQFVKHLKLCWARRCKENKDSPGGDCTASGEAVGRNDTNDTDGDEDDDDDDDNDKEASSENQDVLIRTLDNCFSTFPHRSCSDSLTTTLNISESQEPSYSQEETDCLPLSGPQHRHSITNKTSPVSTKARYKLSACQKQTGTTYYSIEHEKSETFLKNNDNTSDDQKILSLNGKDQRVLSPTRVATDSVAQCPSIRKPNKTSQIPKKKLTWDKDLTNCSVSDGGCTQVFSSGVLTSHNSGELEPLVSVEPSDISKTFWQCHMQNGIMGKDMAVCVPEMTGETMCKNSSFVDTDKRHQHSDCVRLSSITENVATNKLITRQRKSHVIADATLGSLACGRNGGQVCIKSAEYSEVSLTTCTNTHTVELTENGTQGCIESTIYTQVSPTTCTNGHSTELTAASISTLPNTALGMACYSAGGHHIDVPPTTCSHDHCTELTEASNCTLTNTVPPGMTGHSADGHHIECTEISLGTFVPGKTGNDAEIVTSETNILSKGGISKISFDPAQDDTINNDISHDVEQANSKSGILAGCSETEIVYHLVDHSATDNLVNVVTKTSIFAGSCSTDHRTTKNSNCVANIAPCNHTNNSKISTASSSGENTAGKRDNFLTDSSANNPETLHQSGCTESALKKSIIYAEKTCSGSFVRATQACAVTENFTATSNSNDRHQGCTITRSYRDYTCDDVKLDAFGTGAGTVTYSAARPKANSRMNNTDTLYTDNLASVLRGRSVEASEEEEEKAHSQALVDTVVDFISDIPSVQAKSKQMQAVCGGEGMIPRTSVETATLPLTLTDAGPVIRISPRFCKRKQHFSPLNDPDMVESGGRKKIVENVMPVPMRKPNSMTVKINTRGITISPENNSLNSPAGPHITATRETTVLPDNNNNLDSLTTLIKIATQEATVSPENNSLNSIATLNKITRRETTVLPEKSFLNSVITLNHSLSDDDQYINKRKNRLCKIGHVKKPSGVKNTASVKHYSTRGVKLNFAALSSGKDTHNSASGNSLVPEKKSKLSNKGQVSYKKPRTTCGESLPSESESMSQVNSSNPATPTGGSVVTGQSNQALVTITNTGDVVDVVAPVLDKSRTDCTIKNNHLLISEKIADKVDRTSMQTSEKSDIGTNSVDKTVNTKNILTENKSHACPEMGDEGGDEIVEVRKKCKMSNWKLLDKATQSETSIVLKELCDNLSVELRNLGTNTSFFPRVITFDETLKPGKRQTSQAKERILPECWPPVGTTPDGDKVSNLTVSSENGERETKEDVDSGESQKPGREKIDTISLLSSQRNHDNKECATQNRVGNSNKFITCLRSGTDAVMGNEVLKDSQTGQTWEKITTKAWKCNLCDFCSTHFPDVTVHLRTLHCCSPPLTCDICEEIFYRISDMHNHLNVKHGPQLQVRTSSLFCPQCQKSFAIQLQLDYHISSFHRDNKPGSKPKSHLLCYICGFKATTQLEMVAHRTSHRREDIVCKVCGKQFQKAVYLQVHMEAVHTKTNSCTCPQCGKHFGHSKYLTYHMKRHTGVKKHVCPICSWRFFENNTLQAHMEIHKPKEERKYVFSCSYCSAKYSNKTNFRDHLNKHTGSRPYKCQTCSKSFAFRSMLTRHRLYTHSTEKPFTCDICLKAFRFNSKLTEHLVTHTGISKHVCCNCNKAFGTKSSLRQHLKKCKENELWPPQAQESGSTDIVPAGNDSVVIETPTLLSTEYTAKMQSLTGSKLLSFTQDKPAGVSPQFEYFSRDGALVNYSTLKCFSQAENAYSIEKLLLVDEATARSPHSISSLESGTIHFTTSLRSRESNADLLKETQHAGSLVHSYCCNDGQSTTMYGIGQNLTTVDSGSGAGMMQEITSIHTAEVVDFMETGEATEFINQAAVNYYVCSACKTMFETYDMAEAHVLICQGSASTSESSAMDSELLNNNQGPSFGSEEIFIVGDDILSSPDHTYQIVSDSNRCELPINTLQSTSAQGGTSIVQMFETSDAKFQEYHILSGKSLEELMGLVENLAKEKNSGKVQIVIQKNSNS